MLRSGLLIIPIGLSGFDLTNASHHNLDLVLGCSLHASFLHILCSPVIGGAVSQSHLNRQIQLAIGLSLRLSVLELHSCGTTLPEIK